MSEIIIPAARIEGSYGGETITYSIPPFFRDYFWHWEKFLKDKGVVHNQLRISQPFKPRTTGKKSQNHHINGHIQQIAAATDNLFGAVKSRLKELAISRGYPYETLPDGSIEPKSEADISTTEAGSLIDTIHQFADEWNIPLTEEE